MHSVHSVIGKDSISICKQNETQKSDKRQNCIKDVDMKKNHVGEEVLMNHVLLER